MGLAPIGLLGWEEDRGLGFAAGLSVSFYAAALAGTWLCDRRFERGPLELLMRRWTG